MKKKPQKPLHSKRNRAQRMRWKAWAVAQIKKTHYLPTLHTSKFSASYWRDGLIYSEKFKVFRVLVREIK